MLPLMFWISLGSNICLNIYWKRKKRLLLFIIIEKYRDNRMYSASKLNIYSLRFLDK